MFPFIRHIIFLGVMAFVPAAFSAEPTNNTAKTAAPVRATIKTSLGVIELELDAQKAPVSVDNFTRYAKDGHYNGTVFHRVIAGFMVQGGGFDPKMSQKPVRASIKNEGENGLRNDRGTVAMARTSEPDSATSQFYINLKNNDFLNASPGRPGYAVFGRISKGMEVVDKIAAVQTTRVGPFSDVPSQPVLMESVQMVP
jgi:peptidyl-prolyl cis-trans isomerase A (cyclophilin A)